MTAMDAGAAGAPRSLVVWVPDWPIVALTRAIVVARTDAAARECLAESMQRGIPELTMQDAVRAAAAELRRAARERDAAVWTGPVVGAPSAGRGIGM